MSLIYSYCHLEGAYPTSLVPKRSHQECEGHQDCTSCKAYGRVCRHAAKEAGDAAETKLEKLTQDCPRVFVTTHPLEKVPQLRNDQILLGPKLGKGGYCTVYACDLTTDSDDDEEREQAEEEEQEQQEKARGDDKDDHLGGKKHHASLHSNHALKRLKRQIMVRPSELMYGAVDLASEAAFLANLNHPNIIGLHGIASGTIHDRIEHTDYHDKGDGFFIVVDRLKETLDHRLYEVWAKDGRHAAQRGHHHPNALYYLFHRKEFVHVRSLLLSSLCERLEVAHQVAQALAYLHGLGIMYRDVKPDNIGFDKDGRVKLFDFGLAYCRPVSNEMAGSRRYMAPEILLGKFYTKDVDVYSFGVLLYELCSLERPFDEMGRREHLERVVYHHERPKLTCSWWPKPLQDLIQRCWSHNAYLRPSMSQVLETLTKLLQAHHHKNDKAQEEEEEEEEEEEKDHEEQARVVPVIPTAAAGA